MAETAVCFVIDKLLQLLATEAKLVGDLPRELKSINNELGSIRVFLKDAEEKAEEDESVKEWVRQVRSMAYEIEDVIDQYTALLQLCQYKFHDQCYGILTLALHPLKQVKARHRLAHAIKDINSEILQIFRRREAFNLRAIGCGGSVNRREDLLACSFYVEESELVGIDIPKGDVLRLLDLGTKDSMKSVISVVGMGGLGKTTILRKIYDELIEDHFPFHAWVTVSRSYKLADILKSMRRQLHKGVAKGSDVLLVEDEALLIDELRQYLDQKRFMVVLDDVWQMELWTYIKSVLPNNNTGSKIIITTRSEDVALTWRDLPSQGHIYILQPLSPEKSWELFCKKAFQDSETQVLSNPEMKELSWEIVRKCQGLPLAIVSIGGLLSAKSKTVAEWRKLLKSLSSELRHNPHLTDVTRILLLSYHDLDYYLKPCLLYFGLFPEDYHIDKMRLLRLWIAEGFIKRTKGKSMEEIAEEHLIELIRRSLVQVSTINRLGRAKTFCVHDIMREIILLKSEELNFGQVLQGEWSNSERQNRRLAVHNVGLKRVKIDGNIRSFFLFGKQGLEPVWLTARFLKNIRLLKVLDLQDSQVTHLPKEVGNLHQLQYLSLKNTSIKKLPRSIGKLQNLQTLDLKQTFIHELPVEVTNLKNLRHLLAYHCWDDPHGLFQTTRGVKFPKGVLSALEDLQKLACIDGSHRNGNITEELRNLKQLRKLGITHLRIKDWEAMCATIESLLHLRTLMLTTMNRNEFLHLQFIISPPTLLEKLYLKGALEKFPSWIMKLKSIVSVYLRCSRLKEDPVEILKAVHSLEELVLVDAYEGEKLHFSTEGFLKLKLLTMHEMKNLKSISIEIEALPVLDRLSIGLAPQLKQIPFGIQNLKNLTSLTFIDMPKEIVNDTKYRFEVYFYSKVDGRWELCTQ